MKTKVLMGALVALALCASADAETVKNPDFKKLDPGMTKAEAIAIVGDPLDRQFRNSHEALIYCKYGLFGASYDLVWLDGGKVAAISKASSPAAWTCKGGIPDLDIDAMKVAESPPPTFALVPDKPKQSSMSSSGGGSTGWCGKDSEVTSGQYKTCIYSCVGGKVTRTVGLLEFCPMSID
jgi:hypothetical protein